MPRLKGIGFKKLNPASFWFRTKMGQFIFHLSISCCPSLSLHFLPCRKYNFL
jgi:hypothetical protein